MKKHFSFLTLVLSMALTLGFVGCKGSKDGDKKGDDGKVAEAKTEAKGPSMLKLDKLDGLQVEVPADTKAGDAIGGKGVMLQGAGLVMTIEPGEGKPEDVDKAKEDVDMYTPQDLKVEKLEDGFLLTFTNKGGMGTNYWLTGRRTIDGKAYWCSTTAAKPEFVESAAKVCKSLKK